MKRAVSLENFPPDTALIFLLFQSLYSKVFGLFHLAIWQHCHASLSFHGFQNAADGLSADVSVHRNLRLRNHLYIVNAGVRHIHRQHSLCLHLLVLESIYIVKSYVAVVLAVNESYAYRIFIGGNGGEDQFFACISLEHSASFALQQFRH